MQPWYASGMPIVMLGILGVVALLGLLVAGGSVGPLLGVRKFQRATVTPVGSVVKGSLVTVRGTIAQARREPPYPRLTPGDVVWSELTVVERVGQETRTAFQGKCSQVFAVRDEAGNSIDVDGRSAQIVDAHEESSDAKKVSPQLRGYINQQGAWQMQKTPATLVESALRVGDPVVVQGQAIFPMPGEMRDGDSELRVVAKKMSLVRESVWSDGPGRKVLLGGTAFVVAALGCLGCAAWAGWL